MDRIELIFLQVLGPINTFFSHRLHDRPAYDPMDPDNDPMVENHYSNLKQWF